jgi:hypothetical protein
VSAKVVASAMFVAGCLAAPLESQAIDVFANETACPSVGVTARTTWRRPPFETVAVRGCGYGAIYTCNVDIGCARSEQPGLTGPSPSTFPATLVDQVPSPVPRTKDTDDTSLHREPFIVR